MPQAVRTGYDTIIAHRVDEKFAVVSKGKGKVTEVSNNHITLTYEDGTTDRFKIGLNYGVSTGSVVNNMLVTDYTVGQEVNKGDVVAFHPAHFQRDVFDKSQVLFKNSILSFTTFMESNDTEEDSSAISLKLAGKMEVPVTEVRDIVVSFDDTIRHLVNVGDNVESETPLCTIVNAVFTENSMFDKNSEYLDTLNQLANVSPRAKHHGMVTKIEVMYYGDSSTASESVKSIISKFDKERRVLAERLKDGSPTVGLLKEPIRVGGNVLTDRSLVIKFYIEHHDGMGIGDKLVVSNQLKSVVARVMTGVNETKSGKQIDAIFGYQSISNRIVTSAEVIGTTNTLLREITKEVIGIYRNDTKNKIT